MKRIFDLLLSLLLITFFAPLSVSLAIVIRFHMGNPVLFHQKRPGFKENPFLIYKFRTMQDLRNEKGVFFPDDQRMTRLGSLMRKLSLDELPQLFNVLKGEMSFVGPRPLLMEYLPLYNPEQAKRHDVRPGITGWAQVNGRNAISWEDKFKYDVYYVEHQSFWFDLRIMVLTLMKVFQNKDVSEPGQVTAHKFTGTNS